MRMGKHIIQRVKDLEWLLDGPYMAAEWTDAEPRERLWVNDPYEEVGTIIQHELQHH